MSLSFAFVSSFFKNKRFVFTNDRNRKDVFSRMKDIMVGFIGFGLIGGSIARGIKMISPSSTILGYQYNSKKPNENLLSAQKDGVIDRIETGLETYAECDIIFLCAPVLTNITYLKELKHFIKSSCILTDVGSVKGNIYDAVCELGLENYFVGGHPMAGSEKIGYQNSSAALLENAYYILTPTEKTPVCKTQFLQSLVSEIGALPVILNPKEHDDITAAISHVPHIIAAELVNLVRENDDTAETMKLLAAGGFRDITRISSSSPVMWQNICLTNTQSIIKFLTLYKNRLEDFLITLEETREDTIISMFSSAKDYRDSLPTKSTGAIEKVYKTYVDLSDEAGAIATVATALANNGVSIKNIGILHNREFQDGVLHIEFYDEKSVNNANLLLKNLHYTIYE